VVEKIEEVATEDFAALALDDTVSDVDGCSALVNISKVVLKNT